MAEEDDSIEEAPPATPEPTPAPTPEPESTEEMTLKRILFSFKERIGRNDYWLKGMLPVFSITIMAPLVIAMVVGMTLTIMGIDMMGPPKYVLTTDRGALKIKEVTSHFGEKIKVVAAKPSKKLPKKPFYEIGFAISLGAAADDLPKPLSFEKTLDTGTFRVTAVQTLEEEPYDGPVNWRIYAKGRGMGSPPLIVTSGAVIAFMCMLQGLWCSFAVGCKRCHDRGRSGWFQLITLIPAIGQIWLFIELGLLKGTEGDNKYGPDPLAS